MDIRKIIKEEMGDFDWAVEHEATYKVHELEVGKTYQFVPDLSMLDDSDVNEAPSWVYEYGDSKFYIIKQEPKSHYGQSYITFKPIGKANRMVYDGNYTRLPYQARVFMWGKFKDVKNPEFVVESDLDWAGDIGVGRDVNSWDGSNTGGPQYGEVYIYTDSDGNTHSLKVGGVAYKYSRPIHPSMGGGMHHEDGTISFYDSSITQDEIDAINNDPNYPDPFEGKTEITMSRREYNDFIRQGRLTLSPFT